MNRRLIYGDDAPVSAEESLMILESAVETLQKRLIPPGRAAPVQRGVSTYDELMSKLKAFFKIDRKTHPVGWYDWHRENVIIPWNLAHLDTALCDICNIDGVISRICVFCNDDKFRCARCYQRHCEYRVEDPTHEYHKLKFYRACKSRIV